MINFTKNIFILFLIPLFIGAASSFSLPPYDLFFINFFTFPILYLFIVFLERKSFSFIFGWVFGFGYFISSLYWIANALTFDEIFKQLIPISIVGIPLFLGLFYGLATYVASLFKIKKKFFIHTYFFINFCNNRIYKRTCFGGISLEPYSL